MIRKTTIAYFLFSIAICYIIAPWFFEKNLYFNELLAAMGLLLLAYRRFKTGRHLIGQCILLLLGWSSVHVATSLFRMDSLYFYFRNLVIVYSMLSYFVGYYCFRFLPGFMAKIRKLLLLYIGVFLIIPLPRLLFERFGVSVLFPALIQNLSNRRALPALILINIIYSITYKSVTSFIQAVFYGLLLISPGYRFFKQVIVVMILIFIVFFAAIQPNLDMISKHYSIYNMVAIYEVMNSNPLLSLDGNSTWRLVLWKQVLVDHFPDNIFGLGFGTPVIRYFPVEDITKVHSLPYVLGAHNSFIYLFGRLGLVYILLMALVYRYIFKEYFYHKSFYYSNRGILIFWSFFAITNIALFNPTLESPIFAGTYWLILGFLARTIEQRKKPLHSTTRCHLENSIHP